MFTQAILRNPCRAIVDGLTSVDLGHPVYELAVEQHEAFILALRDCGLPTSVLNADERYPDSVFVEDVALCLPDCAIMTNPGAESRRGEVKEMQGVLAQYYDAMHHILPPGTLDAGDVLEVGQHYYIGLSERTNQAGAEQLIQILNHFGATGSTVKFSGFLHLKSGVSWLGGDTLLLAEEFQSIPEFSGFDCIVADPLESYAANAIRVHEHILVASGYPNTRDQLVLAGFQIIELDMSEFKKIDGGLSCLSLRF